jgi:hypothetical protein
MKLFECTVQLCYKETTLGTLTEDTAIFATHKDPMTASLNLQEHLNIIEKWLKKWKIKVQESKSSHTNNVYPPERPLPCSQHQPNIIPQTEVVKYQDYTSTAG